MKRLLLVLLVWAVPSWGTVVQVIQEGNTVQASLVGFTNEAGVATKPDQIIESVDTVPPGANSVNLWLHSYSDSDVTGSSTYSLVTVIPWTSWAIPDAMRRQSQLPVRFSFRWHWHGPGGDDRWGGDHLDVQIERTDYPKATPTP